MNPWFVVSYALVWILLVALFLMVLATIRQIGLIHRRIAPAYGARMGPQGPAIGEIVPPLGERDLNGDLATLGHVDGKKTLLIFLSATCAACDEVAPAIRTFSRSERATMTTILVNDGSQDQAATFVTRHGLHDVTMIPSETLQDQYGIVGSPFALLIDEKGRVQTKGIVNGFDQLESLVRAHELHVDSLESFAEQLAPAEAPTTQQGG